MPSDTRERLTEAAARRFYRDGFRNVGLDQVLSDVGISKTAFYKHFRCKEDLVLAALEMKSRWLQHAFRQALGEHAQLADQLRALFDLLDQLINMDEFQGCIFVNVAMEYPLINDPAHQAAARHKQEIQQFVEQLAVQAGVPQARQMARELCLILEGAYVTRQLTGDKQAMEVARQIADRVIAAYVPDLGRASLTEAKTLTEAS